MKTESKVAKKMTLVFEWTLNKSFNSTTANTEQKVGLYILGFFVFFCKQAATAWLIELAVSSETLARQSSYPAESAGKSSTVEVEHSMTRPPTSQ